MLTGPGFVPRLERVGGAWETRTLPSPVRGPCGVCRLAATVALRLGLELNRKVLSLARACLQETLNRLTRDRFARRRGPPEDNGSQNLV